MVKQAQLIENWVANFDSKGVNNFLNPQVLPRKMINFDEKKLKLGNRDFSQRLSP